MERVFLEVSGTYPAKIDQRTLPTPNLETVPFQSEYRHSAIIWGLCLLNVFRGSVFQVSYLGATVLLMFMWFPFRPFDVLGGFSNRFTIAVMFGATSSTCLNRFLKPKNVIFQMPDLAGWGQGKWSYTVTWFWINEVFIVVVFFVFLTVKNQLNTIGAISWLRYHGAV